MIEKTAKKFYFMGEFFHTSKEFFEAAENFSENLISEAHCHMVFETLSKNIWTNLDVYKKMLTGREMTVLCEELLVQTMNKYLYEEENINE